MPAHLVLAGWSYLNQVLVLVMGLVQVKILTYVLSQTQYGTWVQLGVTTGLIVSAANLNLGHGMLRLASASSLALQHRHLATTTAVQSILALALFVSIWPFSSALIGFLGAQSGVDWLYFFVFSGALLSLLTSQLINYLTITNRALRTVQIATFTSLSTALLIATAAWFFRSVVGVMLGGLAAQILMAVILVRAANLDWSLLRFQWGLFAASARLGVPLILVSLSNWAIVSSNRYIINAFLGADAVARYNVANTLPTRILLVYTLLSSVFFAKISQMYDEQRFVDLSNWMSAAVKYFFLIAVGLAVTIITGSRQLTLVFANDSYWFEELSLVYALLAVGNLLFGLFQIYGRLFDLEKRPLRSSLNWMVAMAVNAMLCWLLIPRFGLVGSAIAMPVALLSGLFVATGHRHECIQWNVKWLRTVAFAVLSVGTSYAFSRCWGLNLGIIAGLLTSMGLGGLAIAFGLALGILDRADIHLMIRR